MKNKPTVAEKVEFMFDNQLAAEMFISWMCESGEQDYWNWQQNREMDDDTPDITGLNFNYSNGSKIVVKCGRFDGGLNQEDE